MLLFVRVSSLNNQQKLLYWLNIKDWTLRFLLNTFLELSTRLDRSISSSFSVISTKLPQSSSLLFLNSCEHSNELRGILDSLWKRKEEQVSFDIEDISDNETLQLDIFVDNDALDVYLFFLKLLYSIEVLFDVSVDKRLHLEDLLLFDAYKKFDDRLCLLVNEFERIAGILLLQSS